MTLDEYLAFEENSPIKHEYVGGEVFAMSGVTTRHNLINLNLTGHLHAPAKRRGCRVFGMDVKLKAATDRIYYPDLVVACGKAAEVELIVDAPSGVEIETLPTNGRFGSSWSVSRAREPASSRGSQSCAPIGAPRMHSAAQATNSVHAKGAGFIPPARYGLI
jgi:hypothetical protein